MKKSHFYSVFVISLMMSVFFCAPNAFSDTYTYTSQQNSDAWYNRLLYNPSEAVNVGNCL